MKISILLKIMLSFFIIFRILLAFDTIVSFDSIVYASSNHEFEEKTFKNMAGFEILADRLQTDGEGRIIFEGQVSLRRDSLTNFFADKMILDFSNRQTLKYIQMLGNVSMTKQGLTIHSKNASSDNFMLYVDFFENITLIKDASRIKVKKLRYYFLSGDILKE